MGARGLINDWTIEDIYLDVGSHKPSDGKGCVMEWASVKWLVQHRGLTMTEAWAHLTDRPDCTEPMIYRAAQVVNDWLADDERQRLVPLIDRLIAARPVADPVKARRCRVRVACWAARSVLDLVRPEDRDACEKAIATVEEWLRGEATEQDCTAAAAAARVAAASTAYAARAAASTANAARAAAYAARAAAERDLVLWLDELLDQWDKARAEEGVMVDAALHGGPDQ
jgi:hypothetical protein